MDFRTAPSGSTSESSTEGKEPASASHIGIGVGKTTGIKEPIEGGA